MTIRQIRSGRAGWMIAGGTLVLLIILACGPNRPNDETNEDEVTGNRYNFVRGKNQLMRIDTAQGGVWSVPENGDGGWVELGEPPDPAGEPTVNGRFGLFSLAKQFAVDPPQLLRVDRKTGRAWLRGVESEEVWIQIDAPEPLEPPSLLPAPATPGPESNVNSSPGTGEVTLPVASREVIESSSGEESEKLAIVVQALEKEGLAVEIQVWAARQLTVFRPEIAVPPLLAALDHERPEVVVAAIGSLKELGDPTTIPRIVALESHSDSDVREAARNAVTTLP